MSEIWPQSKKANIGTAAISSGGLNGQSKIPGSEIQAIADMMDEATSESNTPIPQPSASMIHGSISPEQAADLMIQNYVKTNGGVIID